MEKHTVKDYPLYDITEDGTVINTRTNKALKPIVTKKGYLQVNLSINGNRKACLIHKLVAEAFIPNPDNLPEVDHINTIRSDNRVSNLRWVTRKENENNPLTKKHISEASTKKVQVIAESIIDGSITSYESMAEAERLTGIDRRQIGDCCRGRQKTAKGYRWYYS